MKYVNQEMKKEIRKNRNVAMYASLEARQRRQRGPGALPRQAGDPCRRHGS